MRIRFSQQAMPPAPSPIVPLDETQAHEAGLLGKTKTSDVVDAAVVTTAFRQKATILTSDPDDLERLVAASAA